jgi:hypothetical protein
MTTIRVDGAIYRTKAQHMRKCAQEAASERSRKEFLRVAAAYDEIAGRLAAGGPETIASPGSEGHPIP